MWVKFLVEWLSHCVKSTLCSWRHYHGIIDVEGGGRAVNWCPTDKQYQWASHIGDHMSSHHSVGGKRASHRYQTIHHFLYFRDPGGGKDSISLISVLTKCYLCAIWTIKLTHGQERPVDFELIWNLYCIFPVPLAQFLMRSLYFRFLYL